MKLPPIHAALICAGLMAIPAHLSGQTSPSSATNALGPRLTFATNTHHFGTIASGEKVKCVYIFTNTGDQTLVISNVSPGCHCTTVGDWSKAHQIEPGKAGEIPIQFDSGSFRGEIHRTITVTSNDKLAPRQTLSLDCTIWKPFEISPQNAHILLMPDATSNATTVVHVTSQGTEPVTLSNPSSANAKFKAELKTIKPGKEFDMTVTALPPFTSGSTVGTITVNTSMTNVPVINITVIATLQPAVVVSPLQIPIPQQITRWTTNTIKITSNWSKPLVLSDLEASDSRVSVELKETVPGREFQLVAAFPPGYQVTPGQQVRLTVKSNNEQFSLIKVPVLQFPRRSAASPPMAHPKPISLNPVIPPAPGHP